ncbi:hypothetical protein FQN53_002820 [Emmonsiellopsis sp. PD_33]|nr:hypothetical protein FQN53_002820 [Emmonsiellopsis sp. PD_33]
MANDSSSPENRESFDGFIFGTFADDAVAMDKSHQWLAKEILQIKEIKDIRKFIATARGLTTDEIMSKDNSGLDTPEVVEKIELHIANSYAKYLKPIGGLNRFLEKVYAIPLPPKHLGQSGQKRCAIVTNATGPRAKAWLKAVGINNAPKCVPAPHIPGLVHGYREGRDLIGRGHMKILAIEDNAWGIAAARAAGCQVVGIQTSTNKAEILSANPDWVVKDLERVADSIPIKDEDGPGIKFGIWLKTDAIN